MLDHKRYTKRQGKADDKSRNDDCRDGADAKDGSRSNYFPGDEPSVPATTPVPPAGPRGKGSVILGSLNISGLKLDRTHLGRPRRCGRYTAGWVALNDTTAYFRSGCPLCGFSRRLRSTLLYRV